MLPRVSKSEGSRGFKSSPLPPASSVFQDPFIEPERRRHVDAGCEKRQEAERGPVLNQEKLRDDPVFIRIEIDKEPALFLVGLILRKGPVPSGQIALRRFDP